MPSSPGFRGFRKQLDEEPTSSRAPEQEAPAHPVGRVLDGILRQRPFNAGLTVGHLRQRWIEVVGERLAAECEPAELSSATLLIRASSAIWASQIRFLAGDIASRANEVLGRAAVTEVKVSVRQPGTSP